MRAFPHPFHGATHRQSTNNRKIAVVGAGYWGANVLVAGGAETIGSTLVDAPSATPVEPAS